MDLTAFPSDNLYKYLAIAGLGLVVFSVTYPTSKISELTLQRIDFRYEHQILELEVHDLGNRVRRMQSADSTTIEQLEAAAREVVNLNVKALRNSAAADRIEYLDARIELLRIQLWLTMIIGGVASIAGFALWYFRVQKPQDAALEASLGRENDL